MFTTGLRLTSGRTAYQRWEGHKAGENRLLIQQENQDLRNFSKRSGVEIIRIGILHLIQNIISNIELGLIVAFKKRIW